MKIIVTLLVNGMSLPLVIRWLKIRGDSIAEREERAARIATAQAATDELRKRMPQLKAPEEIAFANGLLSQYQHRLDRYSANAERRHRLDATYDSQRRLWLTAVNAERAELMQMHAADEINDEVLRLLQGDIDIEEALIVGAGKRAE